MNNNNYYNYYYEIPYVDDGTPKNEQHYYYYDFKGITIEKLKKIIEELVNMPPIKIPIWVHKNYDKLKALGIEIKREEKNEKTK